MKKATSAIAAVTAGVSGKSRASDPLPAREEYVNSDATVLAAGCTSEPITAKLHRASVVFLLILGLCAGVAAAQTADAPKNPYTYHNDIFVGGSYLRTQLGPSIKDTNFAGGNVGATHYFTPHLGFAVDGQADYGHASIVSLPSANPYVYQCLFLAGPQIRWSMKRRYSSSIQLLAGAADSVWDTKTLGGPPTAFGFYPNATKLAFNPGTTFDYNLSPRVALRVSSGSLLKRENGDFQSKFNVSTGLLFRIGK